MVVYSFQRNGSMEGVHNVVEDVDGSSCQCNLLKMEPLLSILAVQYPGFSSVREELVHKKFQFHIVLASHCEYLC